MTFKSEYLVGYQFAEFDQAEKARTRGLIAQISVALLGAISLAVSNLTGLIVLAVLSFIGLLIILFFELTYSKHRVAGEAARRATLIVDGLGQSLSETEKLALDEKLQVMPEAAAAKQPGSTYYASLAGAGWVRLLQMIEQSAFFSKALYQKSSRIVGGFVILLLLPVLCGFFILVPQLGETATSQFVRLVLLIFVFILTSGGIRTYFAHRSAASATDAIFRRASSALARNAGEADILSILTDYNATVEASPLMAPGAYKTSRDRLNRLWDEYEKGRNKKGDAAEAPA